MVGMVRPFSMLATDLRFPEPPACRKSHRTNTSAVSILLLLLGPDFMGCDRMSVSGMSETAGAAAGLGWKGEAERGMKGPGSLVSELCGNSGKPHG